MARGNGHRELGTEGPAHQHAAWRQYGEHRTLLHFEVCGLWPPWAAAMARQVDGPGFRATKCAVRTSELGRARWPIQLMAKLVEYPQVHAPAVQHHDGQARVGGIHCSARWP